MKIGVPKEIADGETRVAAVPETAAGFVRSGLEVLVQAGAGEGAFFSDAEYESAGATIVPDAASLYGQADLIVKVVAPDEAEIALLKAGQILVTVLSPLTSAERMQRLAAANVTSFALDVMPRITRAQSMDVLSSMSTISGYKAVLLAADRMGKICPMMMTAAGTLKPAAALIVGAGVAGLQAIATAKRLGAVVTAIDVRPSVAEQVESLGARFIPMEVEHAEDAGGYAADLGEAFYKGEQEIIAPHAKSSDIVITTALIPGRPAPVLITEAMVDSMRPGSVIVDLAAVAGGNCTLGRPDEQVVRNGVTIVAPTNLPAQVPVHASRMFARNVAAFLKEFVTDAGELNLDRENEVIAGTLITHQGRIVHEAARKAGLRS